MKCVCLRSEVAADVFDLRIREIVEARHPDAEMSARLDDALERGSRGDGRRFAQVGSRAAADRRCAVAEKTILAVVDAALFFALRIECEGRIVDRNHIVAWGRRRQLSAAIEDEGEQPARLRTGIPSELRR